MRVYPDLIWIANLQYNFKEKGDYFFHDKVFELEKGIETVLDEYKNSILYQFIRILPSSWLVGDAILDYVKKETDFYNYGANVVHERDIEKAGEALSISGISLNLITQTKYTKYAAAAAIMYLVTLGIVIELLLIYLTKGKNLTGKLAKISRQAKKVAKFLDNSGIEIIPPSIAIYGGMYYYQQKDHRVAMVYEAAIKADPLLAIEMTQNFDLMDMLVSKKEKINGEKPVKDQELEKNKNTIIAKLLASKTGNITGSVTITASLACDMKVKFNSLTKNFTITDNLGNFVNNQKAEVVFKEQINVVITLTGELKKEFKFFGIVTKIEGIIEVKMNGAAAVKTTFKEGEGMGLYFEKTLLFSGIKGTFTGNVKAQNKVFGEIEYKPNEGKPIPFTLIEPHEINLGKVQLFNQNT